MKIFAFFLMLFSLNIFSSENGPCIYFESPSYMGGGSYGALFSARAKLHGGSDEERTLLIRQFPFLDSNHPVAIKIKAHQATENRNSDLDTEVYQHAKAMKSGAQAVPLHAAFSSATPFAFEDIFLTTPQFDIHGLVNNIHSWSNHPVISTKKIPGKTCVNFKTPTDKQTLMIMPLMHRVDIKTRSPVFVADMVKTAISFYRWSIHHNDLFLKNTLTDNRHFFICDFGSAKLENRPLKESANDFEKLFADEESFNQFITQLEENEENNRIESARDFDPNILDPNWKNLKLCQRKIETENRPLKKFLTPVKKSISKKK